MIEIRLSSVVPKSHEKALKTAISVLTDEFTDDVCAFSAGGDFSQTSMYAFLPPKNYLRYDALFAKKFLICVELVAWKLFSRKKEELCCLAEELALNALIEEAEAILELDDIKADFSQLYDAAFQDLDFEMLFQAERDGFEDTYRAREMGVDFLRFEDWFKQFNNTGPVHPYCQG